MTQTAYIYAIGAKDGPQKIGTSRNPQARLAQLQTANHARLVLVAKIPVPDRLALDAERYAHRTLWRSRLRGEWFSVSPAAAEDAIRRAAEVYRAGAPKKDREPTAIVLAAWALREAVIEAVGGLLRAAGRQLRTASPRPHQ